MTETTELLYLSSQVLLLILILSAPVVGIAAGTGLLIGLLQGLTQIQDQTISFAVRLVASFSVLIFTARWMGTELVNFTLAIFEKII